MTDQWLQQLSVLDGTEVYWLSLLVTDAMTEAAAASCASATTAVESGAIITMLGEFRGLRDDVIAQVARIHVPIWQAAAIVRRSQLAHRHPVRVPGT